MASIALVLAGLAVGLTVCTAGTWWTIAKESRPLYSWMSKMPNFVMGIINPLITGSSAIFFNLQNTGESLEVVYDLTKNLRFLGNAIKNKITKEYNYLKK